MQKFNSFEALDYLHALSILGRERPADRRTLEEVLLQKRKEELTVLVRRVIRNELSSPDRALVYRHWYKGESAAEIADALGVDRSTVFRRLTKIERILYDKLKYAMEYRFGECFSAEGSPPLRKALPDLLSCDRASGPGPRIRRLRLSRRASVEQISALTGIPDERLCAIETDGRDLTLFELRALCRCFDVGADTVIFSEGDLRTAEVPG